MGERVGVTSNSSGHEHRRLLTSHTSFTHTHSHTHTHTHDTAPEWRTPHRTSYEALLPKIELECDQVSRSNSRKYRGQGNTLTDPTGIQAAQRESSRTDSLVSSTNRQQGRKTDRQSEEPQLKRNLSNTHRTSYVKNIYETIREMWTLSAYVWG
jgi:hypothetical protein